MTQQAHQPIEQDASTVVGALTTGTQPQHEPNRTHVAVYKYDGDQPKLLVGESARGEFVGQISVPGDLRSQSETQVQCAERVLQQNTGLVVPLTKPLQQSKRAEVYVFDPQRSQNQAHDIFFYAATTSTRLRRCLRLRD